MEKKLNSVLEYLEVLKQGQDRFEERLGRLEKNQSSFAESQARLEENQVSFAEGQARLEENQVSFAESQARLEEKLDNFIIETRSGFKHVQSQLDEHNRIFNTVSDKQQHVQIDINYLNQKTGQHDSQLNNIEKRIQSL